MVIERWSTGTLGAAGAVARGVRRATSSPDDLLVAAHRLLVRGRLAELCPRPQVGFPGVAVWCGGSGFWA